MITIADLIEPKTVQVERSSKSRLSDLYAEMKTDRETLNLEQMQTKYVGKFKLLGESPVPPSELCFDAVLAILNRKSHLADLLIDKVVYGETGRYPSHNGQMLGVWLEVLQREFTMNAAAYV
jgi:hypothetical protein